MRVLLYSPSQAEALPLARTLKQCGFHIDSCHSAERLVYFSMTERYAAVIVKGSFSMDAMAELYSTWKKEGCSSLFVIITPVASGVQRARLLEMGVDHYFIEPHSHTQLVSEILKHEYEAALQENHVHQTTYFEVDLLRRTAKSMGTMLTLTKTEFELLSLLLRRKGIVLSRVQIWEEVWGYEDYPLANTVDVHINRLRKKLPPAAKEMITTVYGIGYRMQSDA